MLIEWMDEREGAAGEQETCAQETRESETCALMRRVMERVMADEGLEMDVMVGVTFVPPERIREINRAFRGVDRVTDVLSFPMIEGKLREAGQAALTGCVDPETGAVELGDLVICVERAGEQAQEYGHSVQRELGYLAAHGMLHLMGYDHETDEQRQEMRLREEAALGACELRR